MCSTSASGFISYYEMKGKNLDTFFKCFVLMPFFGLIYSFNIAFNGWNIAESKNCWKLRLFGHSSSECVFLFFNSILAFQKNK